ncbi:MAG: cold shock domain-containing protein [Candidatus Methanosuratincola sp.]|jgi:CspA family cold shock protein
MRGTIKKLIRDRGFGFIAAEDGKEVFFHLSALSGAHFDSLQEGQAVEYEIETDTSRSRKGQGPRAASVNVVG